MPKTDEQRENDNALLDELLLLIETYNEVDYCSTSAMSFVEGQNSKTREIVNLIKSFKC